MDKYEEQAIKIIGMVRNKDNKHTDWCETRLIGEIVKIIKKMDKKKMKIRLIDNNEGSKEHRDYETEKEALEDLAGLFGFEVKYLG